MKPLRILYVDDEADIREIVTLSLELDPDIEVRCEPSGAAGLVAAAAWRPSAILLDVMMPSMDGPTMLAHLRANPETLDIPVVFITARAQTKEIEAFIRQGARDVITKPFDPMTLAAELRGKVGA